MKKILFLLLLSIASYGQISTGQEQEFDYGVKNNSAQTIVSPNTVVVQGTDGTYGKSSVNNLPLSIATINALKLKADLSTGLLKNGLITTNADPTKFNITAGIGIISNFDDPTAPVSTIINFPAFIGVTPTYLTSSNITYIAINSVPAVVMQASPFTPEQRRDLIILGAVIHSNLTTINLVNSISAPSNAGTNQLHDLMEAIGAFNVTGNKYAQNGANLSLDKSAGEIFKLGVNFASDWKHPHNLDLTAQTALTFRYRTQNGVEGSDVTVINPALYDVGGVLTAVPTNRFSIQTVTLFQTGATRIQYGQATYATLSEAEAAIFTRVYNVELNIAANGIARAYILVRNNATSLQNASDAKIVEAGKFGGGASGGGAITFSSIVAALGYTPENVANKATTFTIINDTLYPTTQAIENSYVSKDDTEGSRLDTTLTPIYAWGDSLTAGSGGSGTTYPGTLASLTNFTITNKGIGGDTSTQIKDRLIAEPANYTKSVIIWAGRNNYSSPLTVKADIATMISALGHTRYLIVSVLNGDYALEYKNAANWTVITQLNADLKALYGNKYVGLREYLVSLQNGSAQDLIDFANDIPPTSLRSDNIHLNATGYIKVAEFINKKLGDLYGRTEYLQSKDFSYYANAYASNGILNQTSSDQTAGFRITGFGVANDGYISRSGTAATFSKRGFLHQVGNINRSGMTLIGTEAGSNTGSNFAIVNFNDSGTVINNPFSIFRSNGNSVFKSTSALPVDSGFLVDILGTSRIQSTFTLGTTPTTSAGTYDILTRNTSSGVVEKILSSSIGTVTNVSALTLGTTGTDLNSSVATGTTVPVITLNVPTASATNRGVLSSTDWNTFNTGARPYKIYSALISQSGTSAPTVIVLENTLGFTPTYSYTSAGSYTINSSAGFVLDKTFSFVNVSSNVVGYGSATGVISTSVINLLTTNASGTLTDSVLAKSPIEIRIYP